MKNSTGLRQFSLISLISASLCPMLVACSSMSMEDLTPQAQNASAKSPTPTPETQAVGDYPNLNIAVRPAAEQITEGERQQIIDELSAKRGRASRTNANSLSEAERIRRIARQSQEETLSAIESAE